jgi:hypothetical protein
VHDTLLFHVYNPSEKKTTCWVPVFVFFTRITDMEQKSACIYIVHDTILFRVCNPSEKNKNLLGSCVGITFDGKLVSYGVNYMFDSYLTVQSIFRFYAVKCTVLDRFSCRSNARIPSINDIILAAKVLPRILHNTTYLARNDSHYGYVVRPYLIDELFKLLLIAFMTNLSGPATPLLRDKIYLESRFILCNSYNQILYLFYSNYQFKFYNFQDLYSC